MLLIIEKTKSQQEKMKIEVKRVEDEIKTKVNADEFAEVVDKISSTLSGFVKDLQTYKIRKYERDTKDYADGTVYDWQGSRRKFPRIIRSPMPKTNRYTPLSTASERDSSEDLSDAGRDATSNSYSSSFLDQGYIRARQRRGGAQGGKRKDARPPTRWSPRNLQRRL